MAYLAMVSAPTEAEKEEKILEVMRCLEAFRDGLERMGLRMSAIAAQRLIDQKPKAAKLSWDSFENDLFALTERVNDEIDIYRVFCIQPIKAAFYKGDDAFGDDVLKKFSSAEHDIREAGRCYALERNTACVFHLMRVLERGLAALANEFGVSAAHTNWQNIIDQIESKIVQIDKTTHGPNWKDEQSYYSSAAVQFRHFKNAWRNHTQHARSQYNAEQARHIFEHVCEFMNHLSLRLSE